MGSMSVSVLLENIFGDPLYRVYLYNLKHPSIYWFLDHFTEYMKISPCREFTCVCLWPSFNVIVWWPVTPAQCYSPAFTSFLFSVNDGVLERNLLLGTGEDTEEYFDVATFLRSSTRSCIDLVFSSDSTYFYHLTHRHSCCATKSTFNLNVLSKLLAEHFT